MRTLRDAASTSTPSDQSDNLQPVAVGQLMLSVTRPRDQFEVDLNSHVPRNHAQFAEQLGDRRAGGHLPRFAVERDCYALRDLLDHGVSMGRTLARNAREGGLNTNPKRKRGELAALPRLRFGLVFLAGASGSC